MLLLQLVNLVLPIIIIPHLVKTIGVELYGVVSLAQILMTFMSSIVDYGFSLTAIRDLSIYRDDNFKFNQIFNNIFFTKLFLTLICISLFIFLPFIYPILKPHYNMYILSFSLLIGQLLSPTIFFQAIEKMKYMTLINIISKTIFTSLVFWIIRGQVDYQWVNILLGLGNIIANIVGIYILIKVMKLKFIKFDFNIIKEQVKNGWATFMAYFCGSTYSSITIIILGYFASSSILGIFGIVEKLVGIIRTLLVVFSQVTYPKLSVLSIENHRKVQLFLKNLYIPFLLLIIVICCAFFAVAPLISLYIFKKVETLFVDSFRLYLFVPVIVCMGIPFFQLLLVYNLKRDYSNVLMFGFVMGLILNYFFAEKFNIMGTIVAVIITELFINIMNAVLIQFKYKDKSLFN